MSLILRAPVRPGLWGILKNPDGGLIDVPGSAP
jgi:hypothetical protein